MLCGKGKFGDIIFNQKIKDSATLNFSIPHKPYLDFYNLDEKQVRNYLSESFNGYNFFQKIYQHSLDKKNKKLCIDKTPQNLYAVDSFLRSNRFARAIVIKRDPRAVLASLINRKISFKTAVANIALEINIINSLMKDNTLSKRILFVDYENLIINPKKVCLEICKFLKINKKYVECMIERKNSSRKNDIKTLRNTLLKTWTSNPLKKISDKSLFKWQDELKALPLLHLLPTPTALSIS